MDPRVGGWELESDRIISGAGNNFSDLKRSNVLRMELLYTFLEFQITSGQKDLISNLESVWSAETCIRICFLPVLGSLKEGPDPG